MSNPDDSAADYDLSVVDPFRELPMTFLLTQRAVIETERMSDLVKEQEALVEAALKRGLKVNRYHDLDSGDIVYRIDSADDSPLGEEWPEQESN